MTVTTYLEKQNQNPITKIPLTENLVLQLSHEDLNCPFCDIIPVAVTTWGSYWTRAGEIRRYYCYHCKKAFNPAKVPYVYERMSKVIFELGKAVIKNNTSISKLAKDFRIPKSTLQAAIAEIESMLEENFEFIKALDEALVDKKHRVKGDLRIIYYDEGFHKLLGQLYYLIFAVNEYGEPIQVDIQSTRDMRVIRDCLEQTISKMGAVDMIVSDGSPAILRAVRSLRKSIILVQQIHSSKGKRVKIIKIDPILGSKKMRELTIELHGESLKFDRESVIRAQTKFVYPAKSDQVLYHQKSSELKKNQASEQNSSKSNINSSRSSTNKENQKKNPIEDVNWIWTPDTNF